MQDLEKLCKENSDKVYRYLFCLTHDKELSEDLTQETMYIELKNINKFRNECPENIWLCKIARNLWYQELKKKKKYKVVDENLFYITENIKYEDMDEMIIQKNEKKELYQAINKLDNVSRQIILLRILGEFSFKDIGNLMDNSETWARVNFYRAKEKLRKIIGEENKYEKE